LLLDLLALQDWRALAIWAFLIRVRVIRRGLRGVPQVHAVL